MSAISTFWQLPAPGRSASRWHVNAPIDLAAYAFSWLWVLVPLELMGSRHPTDYVAVYLFVMGATFAHRHYTLPYVYLDRQVFRRYPWRFTVFPAVMAIGFFASPFLWKTAARPGVAAVAFIAGVWNIWHVYMQKYGILRLYAAKSESAHTTPGGVDKLLIFAWLPLYFVWLGPTYRDELERYFPTVKAYTLPVVDTMAQTKPYLMIPAVGFIVFAVGLFLFHEWKASRLRNLPRLSMALGTTALSATFVLFNPVKAYIAFAFSHALEYMIFVWAYQRRRYNRTLPHDPLLGRLLRHPWLSYGIFTVVTAGLYLGFRYWGRYFFPEASNPVILGTTAARWAFYWGVYQSMVHFYFDGFLWKMRMPTVQENI